MGRTGWLVLIVAGLTATAATLADPPSDGSVEARLRALEQRVSALEQEETALQRQVGAAPAPTAAPAANAAVPVAPAPSTRPVATTPAAPAAPAPPVVSESMKWKDSANWAMLRAGMTWGQVKAILGVPGKVDVGVFDDVMFFPDRNGGYVKFDRYDRVTRWSQTGQ